VQLSKGHDPLGHHQTKRCAPTFKALADEYIDKHLPKKRASSALIDKQAIDKVLLPKLGQIELTPTTREKLRIRAKVRRSLRGGSKPEPFTASILVKAVSAFGARF
jgi:hypothetical protein